MMTENKYKVSKYCVAKNLSCILDKNGSGLMMNKEIVDLLNKQDKIIRKQKKRIKKLELLLSSSTVFKVIDDD